MIPYQVYKTEKQWGIFFKEKECNLSDFFP